MEKKLKDFLKEEIPKHRRRKFIVELKKWDKVISSDMFFQKNILEQIKEITLTK
jgi:hypothetical protein